MIGVNSSDHKDALTNIFINFLTSVNPLTKHDDNPLEKRKINCQIDHLYGCFYAASIVVIQESFVMICWLTRACFAMIFREKSRDFSFVIFSKFSVEVC